MTSASPAPEAPALEAIAFAFAPLHKRRFGIAVGVATGTLILLLTVVDLLMEGGGVPTDPTFTLDLLGAYFAGYSVTWMGALVGFGWGFLVGAVAGWFLAFIRNVVIATQVFLIRTRAELARTRDFLDHI